MEPKRVIFLSAVSNEFHRVPDEQRYLFQSYRDVLKKAFDTLARGQYEVKVQEDLVQGFGTLLETLDDEIARSLFVVHLVGDLAGFSPEPASLRSLHKRHPDLFVNTPELGQLVGDGTGVSYTQWEFYLACHHDQNCLVFEARPEAPRSPLFAPVSTDNISQDAHRQRVAVTGRHRGTFFDQGDVARKVMRSFLHHQSDPLVDPVEPTEEKLAEAWKNQEEIVKQLAAAIKKPDPRAVPVTDPANVAAFVAAVRAAAERWQVNLSTIINIATRYEEQIRAAAGDQPTVQSLYDEAFAQLALGDYTASRFNARRAADLALKLLQQEPEFENIHREGATNALLLLHETARAAHNIPTAIAALEEAGALIDKEAYPLLWADVHEPLAGFLLDQARWERADELISDLIDIREDHQGENHPALAHTLLLWSRLLYKQARYPAMESVAERAERIYAEQLSINSDIAAAMSDRGLALEAQGRVSEAERLLRQALSVHEQAYGKDHPVVATRLNNLAMLLKDTNRLDEAEKLMLRGLSIEERNYGEWHPRVARQMRSLALLLAETDRRGKAEPLIKQALLIDEQNYGADHPDVAMDLNNLAMLLKDTYEAERMMRRALSISERNHGTNHPDVTTALNNLAMLLVRKKRPAEAEPLLRRALENLIKFTMETSHKYSDLEIPLENYVHLLLETGRSQNEIEIELNAMGQPFGLEFGELLTWIEPET